MQIHIHKKVLWCGITSMIWQTGPPCSVFIIPLQRVIWCLILFTQPNTTLQMLTQQRMRWNQKAWECYICICVHGHTMLVLWFDSWSGLPGKRHFKAPKFTEIWDGTVSCFRFEAIRNFSIGFCAWPGDISITNINIENMQSRTMTTSSQFWCLTTT